MKNTFTVGITGGIGSGKSVVCRVLEAMGYRVYDTDGAAKRIMDTDANIKETLQCDIAREVVTSEGAIDRPLLARIVFNDKNKLQRLNEIVHKAVIADMHTCRCNCLDNVFIFESAIIGSAGLADFCNEIWLVTAPEEVRIKRVMNRNSLNIQQVLARISAQEKEEEIIRNQGVNLREIKNYGPHALLPQIDQALSNMCVNKSRFDNKY